MATLKLKVCGMRNHDNIEAIKVLDPDFMGFVFYPESERYIGDSPEIYLFALPSKIKKVAVFVNEDTTKILSICRRFRFDYVQLQGNESPEQCAQLQHEGLKVIKAFAIDNNFDFNNTLKFNHAVDYFLFDTSSLKCNEPFRWQLLEAYTNEKPFFLSGGIKLKDAEAIKNIMHKQLIGVNINSGFEIEPGIKDNRLVAMFKLLLN